MDTVMEAVEVNRYDLDDLDDLDDIVVWGKETFKLGTGAPAETPTATRRAVLRT
ncbi:hypothetical protein [Nonomuraea sp. NPDC052265]|uniref:hypothetical protein n=1 Tax=Nonomuraea sp. NPDC052265 TaxID=3364374 RepID=UPI0037C6F093